MTTFPIIAEYGVKNNAHDLISKSDSNFQPSSLLLNYTDRPPGAISRNENIYPYLSFEVIENYGYIWMTKSDEASERAGMVRSKVLIYPIDDLIENNDIENIIKNIIDVDSTISDGKLKQLFQDLVDNDKNILFLKEPRDSGYFFSRLWKHLSPHERKSLSYRFYLNPSQKSDTTRNEVIYSLQDRENQWYKDSKPEGIFKSANERVANYLLTGRDDLFRKLVCTTAFIDLTTKNRLQKIAFLLNFYDDFVNHPSIEKAILTLRACDPIDNKSDSTIVVSPIIKYIEDNINHFSIKQLKSLANITLDSFPGFIKLEEKMGIYFITSFPLATISEQALILNDIDKQKNWWENFVESNVKNGIRTNTEEWNNIFIKGIIENNIYSKILQFSPDVIDEDSVLRKLEKINKLNQTQSLVLENLAIDRNWSKLYAFALRNRYGIEEAVRQQGKIFSKSTSEFTIILNGFNVDEVVNFFRNSPIGNVKQSMVNDRSLRNRLFAYMDFSHVSDLELISHSKAIDSEVKFITQDQTKLKNALSIMIQEQNSYNLFPTLSQHDNSFFIPHILLNEIDISSIDTWDDNFKEKFNILTDLTAEFLIKNRQVQNPPIFFQNLIADKYLSRPERFIATIRLIYWNYAIDEDKLSQVLINASDEEIIIYGELIGKYLNAHEFDNLINKLYDENKLEYDQSILKHCSIVNPIL